MKKCTKCKKKLPNSAFGKNKHRKDGLTWHCRKCREHYKGKNSEWMKSDVGKRCVLKSQLHTKYGLTLENYDTMLEEQKDMCGACGQPETSTGRYGVIKRLSVDHDHETGKVRGLLCDGCNRALGCAKDSKEILLQLVIYLEKCTN